MGHMTILYKRGLSYWRVGSITQTFEWSDIVAMKVLTCLVHPHRGSLLPSTVLNALVSVTTRCAPTGARINHLSEAWECCSSPSKYLLCRTVTPFSWCPHALFRFESHESLHVTSVMCQHFSTHHIYISLLSGTKWFQFPDNNKTIPQTECPTFNSLCYLY